MKPESAAPAEGGSLPGSKPMPPALAAIRANLVASRDRIEWLIRVIDGDPEARGRARAEMAKAETGGATILEAVLRKMQLNPSGEARRLLDAISTDGGVDRSRRG